MNGKDITGMARDSAEALSLFLDRQCYIALVELNIKGIGGIELIEKIKKA